MSDDENVCSGDEMKSCLYRWLHDFASLVLYINAIYRLAGILVGVST